MTFRPAYRAEFETSADRYCMRRAVIVSLMPTRRRLTIRRHIRMFLKTFFHR